jgi:hypothetical protein
MFGGHQVLSVFVREMLRRMPTGVRSRIAHGEIAGAEEVEDVENLVIKNRPNASAKPVLKHSLVARQTMARAIYIFLSRLYN